MLEPETTLPGPLVSVPESSNGSASHISSASPSDGSVPSSDAASSFTSAISTRPKYPSFQPTTSIEPPIVETDSITKPRVEKDTSPSISPERQYHQRYSPTSTPVADETGDPICFHLSSSLLAEHSTFFEDLGAVSHVPHSSNDHVSQEQVVNLDVANSASFALVLDVVLILDWLAGRTIEDVLQCLESSLRVADFCMIHGFGAQLAKKASDLFWNSHPFILYTIAAAVGEEAIAKGISGQMYGRSPDWMQGTAYQLLRNTEICGDYYDRLQAFHQLRQRSFHTLNRALESGENFPKAFADFGKKCLPKKSGPKQAGCQTYASVKGSNRALYRRAAKVVMTETRRYGYAPDASNPYTMRALLQDTISCTTCCNRVSGGFRSTIQRQEENQPDTI